MARMLTLFWVLPVVLDAFIICPQQQVHPQDKNFYTNGVLRGGECEQKLAGCIHYDAQIRKDILLPFGDSYVRDAQLGFGFLLGFRVRCYTDGSGQGTVNDGCMIGGQFVGIGESGELRGYVYQCGADRISAIRPAIKPLV